MDKIFSRAAGSGHPIIFIHGFCETSEIWDGFSNGLTSSHKVFCIDLPGFGHSHLPTTEFTIDSIAKIVIDWMDENEIVQPMVIGHSLGGYVSLSMGEQAPEKIGGLVLFHSTAYADTEEKKANRNKVIEFVKTHGVDPFVDTFVPGLFWDKINPGIPFADKVARKTKLETLIRYSIAMRDRMPRIEFLKSFIKPFLAIGGKWDTVVPAEVTFQLGELNPRGSSFILQESAHMGMFEEREASLRVIGEFTGTVKQLL